jgi:hypothetical protein
MRISAIEILPQVDAREARSHRVHVVVLQLYSNISQCILEQEQQQEQQYRQQVMNTKQGRSPRVHCTVINGIQLQDKQQQHQGTDIGNADERLQQAELSQLLPLPVVQ